MYIFGLELLKNAGIKRVFIWFNGRLVLTGIKRFISKKFKVAKSISGGQNDQNQNIVKLKYQWVYSKFNPVRQHGRRIRPN